MIHTNMLDELISPALLELDPTTTKGEAAKGAAAELARGFDLEGYKAELLAEKIRFVDATNVNSFVGYRIVRHTYKDAPATSYDVIFGDCERRVAWHGESASKIEAAIAVLQALKADFEAAA